jgi:hypothetical protein
MLLKAKLRQRDGLGIATLPGKFVSETFLSRWRSTVAILQTICWLWTLIDYHYDYPFYLSNWGNTITTVVFWLLVTCHYNPKNSELHYLSIVVFEIAVSLEVMINIIYWKVLFKPDGFDYYNINSYRGPHFNHLLPFTLLTIELLLNGIKFGSNHRWIGVMTLTFCSLNYMWVATTKQPIYFFLNYESMTSVYVLIGVYIFINIIYTLVGILNNSIKSSPEVPKIETIRRLRFD